MMMMIYVGNIIMNYIFDEEMAKESTKKFSYNNNKNNKSFFDVNVVS